MPQPVHEFATATRSQGTWSWRHTATLLLMAVCTPVFLAAALVAGAVALPLLLLGAIGRTAAVACIPAATRRAPWPR